MEKEDYLMSLMETDTNTADAVMPEGAAGASTESFYESRASEYFDRTVAADMTPIYERFFKTLKPGSRIVDLGAGSGRDLKAMRLAGFHPIGVDGSPTLAEMAEAFSGVRCFVMRFEDLALENEFDGAWACASLLHLSKEVLPTVLKRLRSALTDQGSFYISVVLGEGEGSLPDGRFFAFYGQGELHAILQKSGFSVEESWISEDSISRERNTRWLNVIARLSP